jgi:hypothetical protein
MQFSNQEFSVLRPERHGNHTVMNQEQLRDSCQIERPEQCSAQPPRRLKLTGPLQSRQLMQQHRLGHVDVKLAEEIIDLLYARFTGDEVMYIFAEVFSE